MYDSELAFRPELFINPQLKVTWDEDACNASVVVNSFEVTAFLDENPQAGQAKGMIMSKNIYSSVMAASTHDYCDLPVDYAYRGIMYHLYSEDHSPETLVDNMKLSLNNDASIPFDLSSLSFMSLNQLLWQRIIEEYTLDDALTAKTLYTNIGSNQQGVIAQDDTAVTAAGEIQAWTWTGQVAALSTGVAVKSQTCVVSGDAPQSCLYAPLSDLENVEDFLQPGSSSSFRSDITMSSDADSGDTVSIVVDQVMNY